MPARVLLVAALNCFLALPTLLSQTNSSSVVQPQDPVIHTTTREVLLDLVVRDKHHHAVTDLRPEEVEVYEDGVRQNVRVFRNIQGSEQLQTERKIDGRAASAMSRAQSKEDTHPLNSMRQVNFVSVVLGQIAPLNLEFARRAVQEFLKSDNLPNTYITVYRLDRSLQVIQPYTGDKDLLAKAVDASTKGLKGSNAPDLSASVISSSLASVQAAASNILASPITGAAESQAVQNLLANPLPALAIDPLWSANAASQDVSVGLNNALLAQAALVKGLRFSTLSEGMDTMDSLHQLVRSAEQLPGRKVILYLADGLAFPPNRRDAVDNLISYANRAGVSFYTLDTRGLNVDDPMTPALAAQRRTAAESSAQASDPQNGHFEDDDVQLTAVASGQLAMRELAESTGGFAVTNTNEIALPMQHMMEDIRTHYELAYSPTSTNYDGHFRKIEVKISRPKVTLQTRKGYFAVPDLNGEPLQPYELLALNAVNAQPARVEFPYQVSAMKFRPQENGVEYLMTFEIPLSGLKTIADKKTGELRARAALVAFIHDSTGVIVRKVSRELVRSVASPAAAQMQSDRILYAEPVELPPGHYVIDTAVADEQAGKTAAKRISVFVDSGKNLSLSSVELVRRFEPRTGPRNVGSPFELESGRVTPTLADSVAPGNPLNLYFVVYPASPTGMEAPQVTLKLLRDGREIARKPLDMTHRDTDGSIPMLVQVSPGPGQCDVLVTAKQGAAVAE
jgi:VWFA-related protein